jgi:F-type H+-transporting ATPase subunit b
VIDLNATLLIQLANFLLLMFLLNRILFRPMLRLLAERQARTEGRRQKAAQLEADAQAVWEDYQKRLQEAKADADRVRTQLVRQGEAQRDKSLATAAAEAEKAVAQIRARVRAEADDARKSLNSQADRLAAAVAERILGRTV